MAADNGITMDNIALGIYLTLLVAGGLIGFLKANSKASLVASVTSALALGLSQAFAPSSYLVEALLLALLVMFGMRYAKGKKFMPSGLMALLTGVMLILRFVL